MSTDEYDRAEKAFGAEMRGLERLFGINAETIFSVPEKPKPTARVIDLRRTYDIATEHRPWLPKSDRFRCYDRVTFDPDPEGRWHIEGIGASPNEAMTDLLENIGEEIAKG